ncbi:hypothetical protein ACFY7H_09830 [Streptomyces sp. NPDC012794]|uniref:hypothetical protein n=1 Tax=Streptomyces sp. NPDC012794 TaxID=3364850 RepID=UPI0036C1E1C2
MTYTDGFGYTDHASEAQPGFARLLGDCVRMAPHWAVEREPRPVRVAPSQIHGVAVPPSSARLIASTAAYGD